MEDDSTRQFKDLLLSAPNGCFDEQAKNEVRLWSDPPTSLQILKVLDLCVRYSLTSDMVVTLLRGVLNRTLEKEGNTFEGILPLATWRTDGSHG